MVLKYSYQNTGYLWNFLVENHNNRRKLLHKIKKQISVTLLCQHCDFVFLLKWKFDIKYCY